MPVMFTREQYEEGLRQEMKDHERTWDWLTTFLKNRGKLPDAKDFFLHIVFEHLQKNPEYYSKLESAVE